MSVCSLTGQCFFSRCSETEPDRSCTERKIALSRSLISMHILKDFTSFSQINVSYARKTEFGYVLVSVMSSEQNSNNLCGSQMTERQHKRHGNTWGSCDILTGPDKERSGTVCEKVGTLLTPANWENSWCLEGWVCSSKRSRCLWQNRKSHSGGYTLNNITSNVLFSTQYL